MDSEVATRTTPETRRLRAAAWASKAAAAASTLSAAGSRSAPASVSLAPPWPRSNNRLPTASSSASSRRATVVWLTFRSFDAPRVLPARATARKGFRSSQQSMASLKLSHSAFAQNESAILLG